MISLCHAAIVPVCPMCGSHALCDRWRSYHGETVNETPFERDWMLVVCPACGWYGVCPKGVPLSGVELPPIDPKWLAAEMIASKERQRERDKNV